MYVVCCLEVYVQNFIVIFIVLRCWNPDSEHTKKATNIKMNDYTDTWAGHTIYTCLNVYLGPKRCLWKHPTFICQSFKFRLWIKHSPLTAKRISFLLFGLTFYRYARISSKFLRYVRGRISQIWQRAARWNWHRSRLFVLFSRTHLGILKRFRFWTGFYRYITKLILHASSHRISKKCGLVWLENKVLEVWVFLSALIKIF